MPTYLLESWQQVTSLLAMELVFDPKLAAKEGVGTGNVSNAIQQEATSLGTKISQDSKEVMDIRLGIVRNQLQVDIYYPGTAYTPARFKYLILKCDSSQIYFWLKT